MAIIAGSGVLEGTPEADVLIGSSEADTVRGDAGNDVIQTGDGDDVIRGNPGDDAIFSGAGADTVRAGQGNDTVLAGEGNDEVFGQPGNDVLLGESGEDVLNGDGGQDQLLGGDDGDQLSGGAGDDVLNGGAGDDQLTGDNGQDRFVFDPSNDGEGNDLITDFTVGNDLISLNAANILRADPDLPAADANGDPNALEVGDFDASANWDVVDQNGNVTVVHPNGAIELAGVPFSASTDSFAELASANAVEITGAIGGTAGDDDLTGTGGDDVIDGGAGNDTIAGGGGDDFVLGGAGDDSLAGESGDDALTGGEDADRFRFDPSNSNEGDDLITDFTVGEDLIVLSADAILRSDPNLPEASGDPAALEVSDFDADADWNITDTGGNVTVGHPGGTIELAGVPFSAGTDSFEEIVAAGAVEIIA